MIKKVELLLCDVQHLTAALYLLKITNKNAEQKTVKLVKQ
jgi:hypothetical protein